MLGASREVQPSRCSPQTAPADAKQRKTLSWCLSSCRSGRGEPGSVHVPALHRSLGCPELGWVVGEWQGPAWSCWHGTSCGHTGTFCPPVARLPPLLVSLIPPRAAERPSPPRGRARGAGPSGTSCFPSPPVPGSLDTARPEHSTRTPRALRPSPPPTGREGLTAAAARTDVCAHGAGLGGACAAPDALSPSSPRAFKPSSDLGARH